MLYMQVQVGSKRKSSSSNTSAIAKKKPVSLPEKSLEKEDAAPKKKVMKCGSFAALRLSKYELKLEK